MVTLLMSPQLNFFISLLIVLLSPLIFYTVVLGPFLIIQCIWVKVWGEPRRKRKYDMIVAEHEARDAELKKKQQQENK